MKKYIAPEVEIKRFAVENIMNGSEVAPVELAYTDADVAGATAGKVDNVDYKTLFGL